MAPQRYRPLPPVAVGKFDEDPEMRRRLLAGVLASNEPGHGEPAGGLLTMLAAAREISRSRCGLDSSSWKTGLVTTVW